MSPPELNQPGHTVAPGHVSEPVDGFPGAPPPADDALFDGIDFLTRLRLSAVVRGPDFVATLKGMGLPADLLDPLAAARLDARMAERFQSAARQHQTPTPPHVAAAWLQNEVFLLTH